MAEKYYVYELIDPRTDAVFYIGKGCGARIDAHEIEARKGRVSSKCERIREIESFGLRVTKAKVKTFANEQEALDFEAEHIASYGLDSLTNIIPGGGSARNFGPSLLSDRIAARIAAFCFQRTVGGEIVGVNFGFGFLDLTEFIEANRNRVADIVARRGLEWLNRITLRYNVKFVEAA